MAGEALTGLAVLSELAGRGHVKEAGKLLSDTWLIVTTGFNVPRADQKALAGKEAPVTSSRCQTHKKRMSSLGRLRSLVTPICLLAHYIWALIIPIFRIMIGRAFPENSGQNFRNLC